MSSAGPTTIDLDYGQFSLPGLPIDHGSDDFMAAGDAAMHGEGIGQVGAMTVVLSQHRSTEGVTNSASTQGNSIYWYSTAVRNSPSRNGYDSARSFRSFE